VKVFHNMWWKFYFHAYCKYMEYTYSVLYLWILSHDFHLIRATSEISILCFYWYYTVTGSASYNHLNRFIKYLQASCPCLLIFWHVKLYWHMFTELPSCIQKVTVLMDYCSRRTVIHNQLTGMQSLLLLQDKATHKLYGSCWKANYVLFNG